MIVLSKLLNKNHLSELAYNNKKGSCNTCRSLFRTFISFSIFFLSFLSFYTFLFLLFFFNLFQFLLKSSAIHLSRYGQTKREGNPDAQNAQAAWET